MELCVGMICGTIPALRPLLVPKAKKTRDHLHYEMFGPPNKRAPAGNDPQSLPSIFPFPATIKLHHHSRSTSLERIIPAHGNQHIRKTVEVEINNEAVKSTGGEKES